MAEQSQSISLRPRNSTDAIEDGANALESNEVVSNSISSTCIVSHVPTAEAQSRPKQPTNSKENSIATVEKEVPRLKPGLDRMFTHPEGLSIKSYMALYKEIADYLVRNRADKNKNSRGAHLRGEEMYVFLVDYLHTYLRDLGAEIAGQNSDGLMTFYAQKWRSFDAAAKKNGSIFRNMERHWIKREMDEGNSNVMEIYPLHLAVWKDEVLGAESMEGTVLQRLERELEKGLVGVEESEVSDVEGGERREAYVVIGPPQEDVVREVKESFIALGVDVEDGI